jgi:hypothetical protein
VSTKCADVRTCAPDSVDGEYLIFPKAFNRERSANIYCHDMAGTPAEYVTLYLENNAIANFAASNSWDGCDPTRLYSTDRDIASTYNKIRVIPEVNVYVIVSEPTLIFVMIKSHICHFSVKFE